jgi:hypothetical protein
LGTIGDGLNEFVSWGDGGVGDCFVLECSGVAKAFTVGGFDVASVVAIVLR